MTITNPDEYRIAQEQIQYLEKWLERLQKSHPLGSKGYTKSGVRRMIAKIQQQLAVYEIEAGRTSKDRHYPVSVEDAE